MKRLLSAIAAALIAGSFVLTLDVGFGEAAQSMSHFLAGKTKLNITLAQRRAVLATPKRGGLNFSCNGTYCACDGDLDCNDMFTTNVCGPTAVCIGTSCFCGRK